MDSKPDVLTGKAIVAGIAIGKIKVLTTNIDKYLAAYKPGDAKVEQQRLEVAVAAAKDDLLNIISIAQQTKEDDKAKIMEAHLMMIGDPMVEDTISAENS